jgi:hypothetical protein
MAAVTFAARSTIAAASDKFITFFCSSNPPMLQVCMTGDR